MSNKKQNIFLHIGSYKTGTTSVQEMLYFNRELLSEKCFTYPDTKLLTDSNSTFFNDKKNLTFVAHDKNFIKKFLKFKQKNLIFSDEDYSVLEVLPKVISELNDTGLYNVKVICYVRRSIDVLVGLWSQFVKYGGYEGWTVEKYIEDHYFMIEMVHNIIFKCTEILGKDNMIVRSFDKKFLKNGDILADFFDIFKIDVNDLMDDVRHDNVTPSYETILSVSKLFAPIVKNSSDKRLMRLTQFFEKDLFEHHHKVLSIVSDELIQKVCDHFYPVECKIARDYLGKDELFSSRYPSFYGKLKPKIDSITLSMEQFNMLEDAIRDMLQMFKSVK